MKQVTSVGTYGAKVAILRRNPGSSFVLRWRDPQSGRPKYRTTEHRVLTKAKVEALELAQKVLAEREPRTRSTRVTWARLFAWFEETWVPVTDSPQQIYEDTKELRIWRTVLPLDEPVETLEPAVLEKFKQERKTGTLRVDGMQLGAGLADNTVKADLAWLRRVVNMGIKSPSLALSKNPVLAVEIPKTARPKRPVASEGRYEALRTHADRVGSQGLFGGFLDLLRALGWRVSAICQLHLDDVDLTGPRGRIRKRAEHDKEGIEAWVPVSDWLRPRLQDLLVRRTALDLHSPWLFPKLSDPSQPWHRNYARDRLETAEAYAGLEPIEGGDFHPYRRLWATQRKGKSVVDVAYAGGWKNPETLLRFYQQVDDEAVWDVMNV